MRVVIAMEYRKGACGRGYAKVIQHYSAASLRPIFTEHISTDAQVLADKRTGYQPLIESYPNIKQIKFEKGKNFPMIRQQIRNFKNWLSGVHAYCNKEHLEEYLGRYLLRIHRRILRQSILNKALERMILHKPMTRKHFTILKG